MADTCPSADMENSCPTKDLPTKSTDLIAEAKCDDGNGALKQLLAEANGAAEEVDADGESTVEPQEVIEFKVNFTRKDHTIEMPVNSTVEQLKKKVFEMTNVPPGMQKLVLKGVQLKDGSKTLRDMNVTAGAKILLIGSTVEQVSQAVKVPTKQEIAQIQSSEAPKVEKLSKRKEHAKVIERGVPEDAMPGISNVHENLPPTPLNGMRTKMNQTLRLSFKLETDQLWISTNERTSKVNMSDISDIISEPIEGHEQYHIMGFKLGTTEQSRLWVYWVPAQYVQAIKRTVLN